MERSIRRFYIMLNKVIQVKCSKNLVVNRNIMLCIYLFFGFTSFIWCQNINKVNPPSWIIGKWRSETGELIFEKDKIFEDGTDIVTIFEDTGFNVEIVENITDEYYELIFLIGNGEKCRNKFYRPEDGKMLVENEKNDELRKIKLIKIEKEG